MFRLFENQYGFGRTNIAPPGMLYLRSEMSKIENRYKRYYSSMDKFIGNKNQFVMMLEVLRYNILEPVDNLESSIREKWPLLGSMFDVTSYYKKSNTIFPGSFYGENATEVWLGTDENFDKVSFDSLDSLKPLRVLRHGYDTFSFPYLDGTVHGPDNEIVVISMNISMLVYKLYLYDIKYNKDNGIIDTIENFVTKLIIPDLISSHLEVTFLNRIFNKVNGLPNNSGVWFNNPFYIQDLSSRIDGCISNISKRLLDQPLTYGEILSVIPALFNGVTFDVLRLPKTLINNNNRWGFLIAYLPLLNNLVLLDKTLNNNRNLEYRGRTLQLIRFLMNDGSLMSSFTRQNRNLTLLLISEVNKLKNNIESFL
jgi:hypothetical protein